MSAPHVCPLIVRFCKRGHPRTLETTFERKVTINGKVYISRECRICHAERSNRQKRKPWSVKNGTSKWKRFLAEQGGNQ